MIFVTTGTQLPFDRLVKAVDSWAEKRQATSVFAQIGKGSYRPRNFEYVYSLSPVDYDKKFNEASVVISHVGMGTIISGLERAKPLLLMPRLASLGEHRNDHQLSTAEKFNHHSLIRIVNEESQLPLVLDELLTQIKDESFEGNKLEPSDNLINRIRTFIEGQ